ncbi:uncharacterized protein BX663DRAFT_521154 [Cokeromyces recurvatus]|uniref:uncharacterized protein n=1 Tax=Cokeromyces recurvatus TaxID=90255 RepID=UPI002220B278|nr:uncharacterized protein BX663DRAFT_521154 [Cokeromyces recurvatus]KAI7899516.1 hypothetical protein BX663DRAFT_521154 [Cokeromyces recurvatus]
MNVAAKDSMADNELEETEDNLVNLILEKGRLLASSNKVRLLLSRSNYWLHSQFIGGGLPCT